MTAPKPSVNVAIPAYNEAGTIISLIQSVKSQDPDSFVLNEIRLYYDGGHDDTVSQVKKHFPQVRIYAYRKNLGKTARINNIMSHNDADILIQIDADVILSHSRVFSELVRPFLGHPQVGMVCAYLKAAPPRTYLGRIAQFGFRVWDLARDSLGALGTRYYCEGGLRAFSRQFASQFRIPLGRHIGEDTYSFYWAVTHGFVVRVAKRATAWIELPETYSDYVRQMKRFLTDPAMARDQFAPPLIAKFETMTSNRKLVSLARELVNQPLVGAGYLILQGLTKLQMPFYKPPVNWSTIRRK